MDSVAKKVAEKYRKARTLMPLNEAAKVLGISPSATLEEATKAFRALMIHLHPDRNKDPEAAEQAKKVTEAYHDLKDRLQGGMAQERPVHQRPEKKEKVHKGQKFDAAKSSAPHGVDWKFRSEGVFASPTEFVKKEDPSFTGYAQGWIAYGQTSSHHVFLLVEHTIPNQFSDVLYNAWSMENSKTYPLAEDLSKLAPKAAKALAAGGKLIHNLQKTPSKWFLFSELSEGEFEHRRAGGASLKDIIPSAGLGSASSDRKATIEIEGKLNPTKRKEHSDVRMNLDTWKWYDFTVYVNGKSYKLSDQTMQSLSQKGTSGNLFWFAVYGAVQYDYGRKRVLTKLRGGLDHESLKMILESLHGEPADLEEALKRGMAETSGKQAYNYWRP
jgi:curved DNA-binding protein CbpA